VCPNETLPLPSGAAMEIFFALEGMPGAPRGAPLLVPHQPEQSDLSDGGKVVGSGRSVGTSDPKLTDSCMSSK
jgi:hypothetical protein